MPHYRRSYSYQPVSQSDPIDLQENCSHCGDQDGGDHTPRREDRKGSLLRSSSEPSFDKDTSESTSLIGVTDYQVVQQGSNEETTAYHVNEEINMDMEIRSPGHEDHEHTIRETNIERQTHRRRIRNRKRSAAISFLFLSFISWVIYFAFGLKMALASDKNYSDFEGIKHKNIQEKFHRQEKSQEDIRSIVKRESEAGIQGSQCFLEMDYSEDLLNTVYTNNDSRCQLRDLDRTGLVSCLTRDSNNHIEPICFCFNVFQSCMKNDHQVLGESGDLGVGYCERRGDEVCHNNGRIASNIPKWSDVRCNCNKDYTGRYCHLPKKLVCWRNTNMLSNLVQDCSRSGRLEHYPCQHMINDEVWSCRPWNGTESSQLPNSACSEMRPLITTTVAIPVTTNTAIVNKQGQDLGCVNQTMELIQEAQVLKEKINRREIKASNMIVVHCSGALCQFLLLMMVTVHILCDCKKCSFLPRMRFHFVVEYFYKLLHLASVGIPCVVFGINFAGADKTDYVIIVAAMLTPFVLSFLYTNSMQRKDVHAEDAKNEYLMRDL